MWMILRRKNFKDKDMDRTWYKSYSDGVPETINPDAYTSLIEPFEKFTKQYADLPAFSNFGSTLTYQDLYKHSIAFASYLQSLGLKKGDRVAIMLPNVLQYPVVLFGILCAGMTVVNVNPLYTPPELIHQLKDAQTTTIIVLSNFAKTLEKALPDTAIEHVIVTDVGDLMGGFKKSLVNFVVKYIKRAVPAWHITCAVPLLEALAQGAEQTYSRPDLKSDDIAFLQYTGGTTGHPKGAMLTHRNVIANVLQCSAWVKAIVQPGEDVVLGALPLYHVFSLTICAMTFLALGVECLLVTNPRDMNSFVKLLSKTRLTVFVGLNTLFNGLLQHPKFKDIDFSALKLTVAGGMAVQRSVAEAWHDATGTCILQGYGLTEASPVVAINPIDVTHYNESIGVPVSATDVILRDSNGHVVENDAEGELCVKGPQVMKGYWQLPDSTRKVIDEDGWLRTGDIARIDERGFLYIVDRKKDMVLVSGFNVYPNEIEEVLSAHPDIKEVAVIGVPYEKTGEAVKAFIVKKNNGLSEEGVLQFCRQSLTGYKVPKFIEFRDALPKSNVGKVLRRELREESLREA
jgi:long-chain acyl-CoA synthetase